MSGRPIIIVPESTKPVWRSPEKAREFWDGYIDVMIAKWGEIARVVASRIGYYTVKEIYETVARMDSSITLSKVVDILLDLYEKKYIEFSTG